MMFSDATMVCIALHLLMLLGRVSKRFPLHLSTLSRVHRPIEDGRDLRRLLAQLNSLRQQHSTQNKRSSATQQGRQPVEPKRSCGCMHTDTHAAT